MAIYQPTIHWQDSSCSATQLADELRGMLSPSAEVSISPARDVNGAPIGPSSVWATVYHMSELYLAYGFLRMYGGKE